MKFDDLMNDHSVAAVRKERWANKNDRLVLPPVIDGQRAIWCKLIGHDGVDPESKRDLLVTHCRDNDDDWEVWEKPQ